MKLVGLGLNAVGFVIMATGIARKSNIQEWAHRVWSSTRAIVHSSREKIRNAADHSKTWANDRMEQAWRAWQAARELVGLPKNARGSVQTRAETATSASGTKEEAPPSPELNQWRIVQIEERAKLADAEAKHSDILVLVGGLVAFLGNVVLAMWT